MDADRPYNFIGFGAMCVTKSSAFIGFGAMDATKPYEFIWLGDIHGSKPYKFIGLWYSGGPHIRFLFGGGRVPPDLRFRGPLEAKSFVRGRKTLLKLY